MDDFKSTQNLIVRQEREFFFGTIEEDENMHNTETWMHLKRINWTQVQLINTLNPE